MTQKEEDTLRKIKSKGYWEIEIRPTKYKENKLTREECQKLVQECKVSLRGWDYPPVSNKIEEFFIGKRCMEGIVDYSRHIEIWRLYQSGQFVHYQNFWEDWMSGDRWRTGLWNEVDSSKKKVKGIVMTLYTVTEIFEFASRLASRGIFDDQLMITMKLHDTAERSLALSGDSFAYLRQDYKCMINPILFSKQYSSQDIIANSAKLSLHATIDIFTDFNWQSKDLEKNLRPTQEKFLKGLI